MRYGNNLVILEFIIYCECTQPNFSWDKATAVSLITLGVNVTLLKPSVSVPFPLKL